MKRSDQLNDFSPQIYARTGGILYVILIILGIIQQLVIRSRIVNETNAAITALNLKSMEMTWRLGIVIELFMITITICLCLILYVLTRPVNKNLALLAVFFELIGMGTEASYCLQLVEALFPLSNLSYLTAFTQEQLNAMASLYIRSQSLGFAITLLLFGPFFFITGYLIFRSQYFPKLLGILYMVPGISYSVSSLLLFLAPAIGSKYYFFIVAPVLIGELSLALWLLVKGVRIEKWNKLTNDNQLNAANLV